MTNGIDTNTKTFTAEEMCSEIDKLIADLDDMDVDGHLWYDTFKTLINRWQKEKGNAK